MEQFYVSAPRAVSARMAAELTLAPASTHLLVGGVGSGKTTELLATGRHMAGVPDMLTFYVDVSKQHDIAKMVPGAVIAQVALGFAEQAERNGYSSEHSRFARNVAFGSWEDPEQPDPGEYGEYGEYGDYVPGILISPELVEANVVRARVPLEGLLHDLRARFRHFVVMLDGLDRIGELPAFEQIVAHDVKTLTSLGVGVVLVGPLRAIYGLDRALLQGFDTVHYQPWIDVIKNRDGFQFLAGVLSKRAAGAFDPSAINALVFGSGGVLRDLLSLSQSALVEAYLDGAEFVGEREVGNAVDAFGRKHMQGLRPAELDVLQRVRTRSSFVQTSEDDLALLMTRRVLEYRSDKLPRYEVHPTIEPLLRELAV